MWTFRFSGATTARRTWLAGALAVAAGALPRPAPGQSAPPIRQPSAPSPKAFMLRALQMRDLAARRGDQAFGAVVVKDGRVVGEGVSAVITRQDPTAHGEVEAIRDAARRLGTRDLSGCELYTSFKPCPMCETAAYWARIARVFHGEAIVDAGAPAYPRCG